MTENSRSLFTTTDSWFQTTATAAAKSLQSCPTLCDGIDSSPPGSSVHGILQTRILEWVASPFSNACMHACMHAKSLQSCLTPCEPMDSSPPGSSVHGILQTRILEWVALSFSHFKPHMLQILSLLSGIRACQYWDCHLEDARWNYLVSSGDNPFRHYWN